MDAKSNSLNWFEIPVSDMERAKKFYSEIFGIEMYQMNMGGADMAFFPMEMEGGKVGGAIIKHESAEPCTKGTVVYLNSNPDMMAVLDRVEKAGGKIATPRTLIAPEIGYSAFIIDTEGNRVGLHSNK
ncbi:VOC family protein [soil metagenome]